MRLIATAGAFLSVIVLTGCGFLPTAEVTEPTAGATPSQTPSQAPPQEPTPSPEPDAKTDETDDERVENGDATEAPTGLKAEFIRLGWECEDVSFNDAVLETAFNCSRNGEYIGLSLFTDEATMSDYAVNVSADSHCKVYDDAKEAYWATHNTWLLEFDQPSAVVDEAVSELDFEVEKTAC